LSFDPDDRRSARFRDVVEIVGEMNHTALVDPAEKVRCRQEFTINEKSDLQ
jgi:hypothetical protein